MTKLFRKKFAFRRQKSAFRTHLFNIYSYFGFIELKGRQLNLFGIEGKLKGRMSC